MGKEGKNLIFKLRKGDQGAVSGVKNNVKVDEKFTPDNFLFDSLVGDNGVA